jgi:hypothetical protein
MSWTQFRFDLLINLVAKKALFCERDLSSDFLI